MTPNPSPVRTPTPSGRKRNPQLDGLLLDAALDILADIGPTALTMDLVASRAGAGKATIYRRWSSKAELITEALAHFRSTQVDLGALPDTGTLRDDLLSLFRPQSPDEAERRMRIMTGLASLLTHEQAFAADVHTAVVQPWAQAHLALMQRAQVRGEISATADLLTLSQVVPAMAAYRSLIQRQPFDLAFLEPLVDGVLLPALRP
ncbi:TetR/AcrR family transcriptional regulator [Deinococcus oregonensis]|uniref:TetR/AcrR family transcriptional regulator n=1 Tax=Deinococcus oregonensis TaxID=1805970 RepID=A0ABV6AZ50_9DEIO